jgi:hypothetical protein
MGEFVFVIESTCLKEGGTFCGNKETSAVLDYFFVGWLRKSDSHPIGGACASPFFNEKPKAAIGITLRGQIPNLGSRTIC